MSGTRSKGRVHWLLSAGYANRPAILAIFLSLWTNKLHKAVVGCVYFAAYHGLGYKTGLPLLWLLCLGR